MEADARRDGELELSSHLEDNLDGGVGTGAVFVANGGAGECSKEIGRALPGER